MSRIPILPVAILGGLLAVHAGAQTRVQLLHASDLEGGVEAVVDAPNFAAVVQALENDAASRGIASLLLSSGDNFIPSPFYNAAADGSLRNVLRAVLANPFAREGVGRVDVAIMNVLGLDASAVGNHEFDAGTATLAEQIGTDIRGNDARWLGVQFPYLSANLDFATDSSLARLYTAQIRPSTDFRSLLSNLPAAAAAPKLAPAAIVVRGTERFGIVGATTPLVRTISSIGGVTVREPGAGTNDMAALAQVLQPTVDAMTNLGVDKIVLVSHLQQFALEQQLIGFLRDVDVVIAGGSDTILADATDRLRVGDVPAGTYPAVATNANGEPALLVSTDGQYSYVGRLVVDFDANGVVVPASIVAAESGAFAADEQGVLDLWGNLVDPFAAGTKGSLVRTLTDAVRSVVIAKDGVIAGRASVFLEGRRSSVRTEETNLGVLTAEANLAAAQGFDPTVLVSHKNGGGIRNPIGSIDGLTGELGPTRANPLSGKQAGEISQLDIEDSLRFNNALTLLTVTRQQLKAVLEHAVAGSTTTTATPGQFGQFAGISFSFDRSRPVGDRVRYAALTAAGAASPVVVANGAIVGGAPVRLVTLNFLADGGDGYPFPTFTAADPVFANRVDLVNAGLPAGNFTFATAGTEQDAMAEHLFAEYSTTPYAVVDTAVAADELIQQLDRRNEGVLAFVDPPFQVNLFQDTVRDGPLVLDTVGALRDAVVFNFIAVGCSNGTGPWFGISGEAFSQVFLPLGTAPFHVMADADGIFRWTAPTMNAFPLDVELVAVEIVNTAAGAILNRVSAPICRSIEF